jgi:GGDEF domain-containing protein
MPLFDSLNAGSASAQTHRLNKATNIPTTEELKYAFEEAKKKKKVIELPFEHPYNHQNFIVKVQLGVNTAPPLWSFLKVEGGRARLIWSRATVEIMMIQSKVAVDSNYVHEQQVQQNYGYAEEEPPLEEYPEDFNEPPAVAPIIPPSNPFGMLASAPSMFQQPAGSLGGLPGMDQPPPSPPSPFGSLPAAPPPAEIAQPQTFVPQAQPMPPNPVPEAGAPSPEPSPAGQWGMPPEQFVAQQQAAAALTGSPFAPPLPTAPQPLAAAAPPVPAPMPAQTAAQPMAPAAQQPAAVPRPQAMPPQVPPAPQPAVAPQKSVGWGSPSAPPLPPAQVPSGGEVTVPAAVPLDWTAGEEARNVLTDPKTGYLSNSALMFFLMRSWNDHKRDASPFALVIYEILIQYPDGQVIPLPPEALVPLSPRLSSACGSLDIMTYMNGDFVVLLPSCDRAGMAEFCQRLYSILTETPLLPDANGKDLAFISIGGASTETSPEPGVVVAAARQAKEMAKQARSTCTMFP